ncbi:ubiquitin carboxyl-terminal hydrolase 4 [Willisornis vidua]|uniref:Ubiquitin carboxyl-terminal hydrolase 4 n=1 Tax=Willisornis vidua TaxID=1566151 RepID=A0ABQ9DV57_9PASS|nr:ubiquitin carboxyl-terminal hydrolase 4 [Willisornis vidua]
MEDTQTETETQAITPEVIVPIVKKKKRIRQSTGLPHLIIEEEGLEVFTQLLEEGEGAGQRPSTSSEEVRQIKQESEVTWSLNPSELQDLQRDYSRQAGEWILTWLLWCWDNGADSQQLEGLETKQLGSLSRDHEILKEIGKERAICSLWRQLLSSVREGYPFKEDLMSSPRKWTTADEGIQYL